MSHSENIGCKYVSSHSIEYTQHYVKAKKLVANKSEDRDAV